MKAAVYYSNRDVRIEEMPKPKAGEGELLVKVKASSICGSDVMEWYRKKKAPIVLGHEVTGVIEEVGKGVKDFAKGERVFVTHHVPCNECWYCGKGKETVCDTLKKTNFIPGGFAEFIRIPKINVEKGTIKLPEGISFEEGSFIEPLGCVVRGQRIAGMRKESNVLVLGSGISGLLHIQLAKVLGARKVIATDVNEYRLNAAEKFGADKALKAGELNEEKLIELNKGRKADLVIVCTGAKKAFTQAFESVEKGGTILLFAPTLPGENVEFPVNEVWMKGVTVTTSYAAVKEDLMEAIKLIREKKVKVKEMITHKLKLEEIGKGFELVEKAENSIKVIIYP